MNDNGIRLTQASADQCALLRGRIFIQMIRITIPSLQFAMCLRMPLSKDIVSTNTMDRCTTISSCASWYEPAFMMNKSRLSRECASVFGCVPAQPNPPRISLGIRVFFLIRRISAIQIPPVVGQMRKYGVAIDARSWQCS